MYKLFISIRYLCCRAPRFFLCLRWMYLVMVILLLLLFGAVLMSRMSPAGVRGVLHQATQDQKFTIILQTHKHTVILLKLLKHYQAVPHLQQIVIVWNNVGKEMPLKLWNSLGHHPVPVVFKKQSRNLIRNRLQPFSEIDTDGQFMHMLLYDVCIFPEGL